MEVLSSLRSGQSGNATFPTDYRYFEMFGNRAIYHEGWLARVMHRVPWQNGPFSSLQEDVWELYNTEEDFSLSNNLAGDYPEKLEESKKLFDHEAIKNNVYPLLNRAWFDKHWQPLLC